VLFNFFYRKPTHRGVMAFVVLALWAMTQIISVMGVGIDKNQTIHTVLYYHPLIHINEFLMGNVAALFFLSLQETSRYRKYDGVIIFILVLLGIFIMNNPGLNIHNGLLAVFIVPLIWFLSYNTGFLTQLFIRPSFVLLGEISYGIYIYQKPVRYYLYKFYAVTGMTQREFCFYGFLAVLILFSYCSYRFIEQPLRRIIQERLRLRLASSSSPNINIR